MAHSLSGNTFYGGFRNGRVQLYDIRASRSPMRGFHESSAVCDILPLYVTNNALDPYSCDSPYIYTSVMNGQVRYPDLQITDTCLKASDKSMGFAKLERTR